MIKNYLNKYKNLWDNIANKCPKEEILTLNKNEKWDEKEFFKTGIVEIIRLFNKLKSFKKSMRFDKALDFGCGIGRLTYPLSEKFKLVLGIDISKRMIEKANKNNYDNIFFINNVESCLEFVKSESFDFIFSKITLQHNSKEIQISYINDFCRILKPNGIMAFQTIYGHSFNIKGILYFLLGNRIVNKLKKIFNIRVYEIEMHTIKIEEVIDILNMNKLKILDLQEDNSAGNNFLSYMIYAEKR